MINEEINKEIENCIWKREKEGIEICKDLELSCEEIIKNNYCFTIFNYKRKKSINREEK